MQSTSDPSSNNLFTVKDKTVTIKLNREGSLDNWLPQAVNQINSSELASLEELEFCIGQANNSFNDEGVKILSNLKVQGMISLDLINA